MSSDMILCLVLAGILLVCGALVLRSRTQLKKIKRSALVDPATGGHTELAFQAACRKLMGTGQQNYSVIALQVDNLSQLCRILGPSAGQEIQGQIYEALKTQLGGGEPAARTGEDAFCFLLKNRKPDEICARLDRICTAAQGKKDHPLRLSCGIYLPEGREDITLSQSKAVFARRSGSSGRRYHFYDQKRWEETAWERDMAKSIDHALQVSEFVVYYQPKVRVSDQKVAGAEALVRWRHPQRGLLSPEMFLPVAEQHEKLADIDRYVFESVCRTLARWKKQGREACPVSVNLWRADLDRTNFADDCYAVCSRYQVDPALIEFEIKEELLSEDPERAKFLLERFHALGFRCAVDNFGAGSTSLQLLGTLDIDTVKLDESFFSGDNNSRRGRYIVEALLKLTTQLHIRTVAEGIDNPGQVKYLQQIGCDMIQGFHFFKPMSQERFENEVYNRDVLTDVEAGNPYEEVKAVPESSHAQVTKSIIQFSYQIQEDVIVFSEPFSPVLGGRTRLTDVMALFRTSEIVHENDREDFFRLLERCRRERSWVENTLRFYMSGGRYNWLEVRMHRTEDVISGILVNVAQWKSEVDRWKEKATRDTLTGLYNREHFEQAVRTQLEQNTYESGAMLFIDVDDFKRVNDTLGHMFGDDVLCWVAKQLLGVFRHTDVIARYGGDEFVVFAPSIQRPVLEERLKRLCGAFQFPYRNDTMEYKVSGSIGAAMYPQDGADYETLLDHADCALYEAKSRGKDQYVVYESYMQGDVSKR